MAETDVAPSGSVQVIEGGGAVVDRLLAGIRKRQRVPLHAMPLDTARAAYAAAAALLDIAPEAGATIRVHPLDTHADAHVRVSQPATEGPLQRVLVWVHGGGFCLGSAASSDALCHGFAGRLDAAVVSVEYRLTPDHTVRDALTDVAAAITWARRRYPGAVMDVLGESAGATLALAAVARMADTGEAGPPGPRSMVLCYPLVPGTDGTPSRVHYETGHYLTMADIAWMDAHSRLDGDGTTLAALSRTHWPADMPRTMFALPHRDPLFDEGRELAGRMRRGGVAVSEVHLPELIHGCLHMAGLLPEVVELHDRVANFLQG